MNEEVLRKIKNWLGCSELLKELARQQLAMSVLAIIDNAPSREEAIEKFLEAIEKELNQR